MNFLHVMLQTFANPQLRLPSQLRCFFPLSFEARDIVYRRKCHRGFWRVTNVSIWWKYIKAATIWWAHPPIVREPLLQVQYPFTFAKSSGVMSSTGHIIQMKTVCFLIWNREEMPFTLNVPHSFCLSTHPPAHLRSTVWFGKYKNSPASSHSFQHSMNDNPVLC